MLFVVREIVLLIMFDALLSTGAFAWQGGAADARDCKKLESSLTREEHLNSVQCEVSSQQCESNPQLKMVLSREQWAVQSIQGCHWTTNHGFKSLRHLGSTFLLPLGHQDWVNKSMESMQKVYLMLRQGARFSSVFLLGTRTRNSRAWLTMTFFIKWIRSRNFLVE